MPSSLATYVSLPGTTAEAMEHWHDVFGGELVILRYGDLDLKGMPFTPDPQSVAHSTLTLLGGVLAGGDVMDDGGDHPVTGTAYSLLYTTDTADEARTLIQKLLDGGGSPGMPFEEAPWGGWYGQVTDRYGVLWAFSSENG